ncbi:MAG: SDR family oxidoreductase [Streptosporangiaceae bacterium]|nr:SDR family oxidoreductase [Streptosporangiaceae bacterium]
MDLGLEHKVALVAGGSSGLGLAMAKELAAEGAHVAIGARDRGRLADADRAVKALARGEVTATSVDITDQAAARRWVEETAARFGALHILAVSGGSPPVGGASQFSPADYQAAFDGTFLPAVNLALSTLPHLRAARWGRILFVASETAVVPMATLALSGAARAALTRFAQSLAAEVGRDGITVNVLAPGATRTQMVERAAARLTENGDIEAPLQAIGEHSAVGRIGRPDEFAAVAAFLASERASYVTGGVHLLDGGASVLGQQVRQYTTASKDTYT